VVVLLSAWFRAAGVVAEGESPVPGGIEVLAAIAVAAAVGIVEPDREVRV